MIVFIADQSVVWSLKCQKMVKNAVSVFQKLKMTASDVLFCPQPKYIQFTVRDKGQKPETAHI